ncbi:MAG TPA: Asp-tRNA(Asn)/Glu-tRNA(Gln) amidotransferase subunit GatB [Chitinophagaceae bacterium]|jgi:aspartyl-tRNA(Asn)/glutamyl-tRNA(Gln) amidotransferase subunit B|nr:Asp-tRNA(Asn)/Glu-tRNA(Gln) amidotransferase subunit GatB [Chitinophagaceae bacterium]
MRVDHSGYETVIGLEVHAQLLTKSKLFCSDIVAFGLEPNTAVSPITLAHPGTLPKMNRKAIELAIRMGLACHCEIVKENYFVRKNYFYPDLPKGYQVSQHATPICKGGTIKIKAALGERVIQLNRIHLEEDAGKSIHDMDPDNTCIDYNRAGTPLIEIVTEPDIRSSEEAFLFLTELRKLVRYLDVCDGNMEEGSLRCDANISVRKKGETKLGTKVEVKNLNSIRNVKRAIEFEEQRLIQCLENGETIVQQTRSFDADKGTTFSIREKEEADDYRYFPEPDLTPFHLSDEFIKTIRKVIPALQRERIEKYTTQLQLSAYDAEVLTEEKNFADYFEKIIEHTSHYKPAANWMLGPVRSWLNENKKEIDVFPLSPEQVASLVALVESGKVSFSIASTRVFSILIKEPGKTPQQIAEEQNLMQQSDYSFLQPIIDEVLNKFADKVAEYKKGKKGLLALFVGEVMKRSKGKADPAVTNQLILNKLKSE